jgi:hypothetical protein
MAKIKKTMVEKILEFVTEQGDFGATRDEVVAKFGRKHYSSVTARIAEMVNPRDPYNQRPKLFPTLEYRYTSRGGTANVLVAAQFSSLA